MAIGVIGRKAGMTRIFTAEGASVPVTVIEVEPNHISQLKSVGTDGYTAVQVASGTRKPTRITKSEAGHFAKAGVSVASTVREFRLDGVDANSFELGAQVNIDRFSVGQAVDVRGLTKGRGFAGVVRRHRFRTQDATHGNSLSHRAPGSIGQCQTPGRVFKGKRMAGHMGHVNRCQQNLEIVRVDLDRQLLLVKGSVPGPAGGRLLVVPSVKQKAKG